MSSRGKSPTWQRLRGKQWVACDIRKLKVGDIARRVDSSRVFNVRQAPYKTELGWTFGGIRVN
jgi:hypothetical protein